MGDAGCIIRLIEMGKDQPDLFIPKFIPNLVVNAFVSEEGELFVL